MSRPPIIQLENVSKRFGGVDAVDSVSFGIAEGEFFALLGPSGCGKTTLLRLLAGLENPDSGRIVIDGADMAQVPANRRPLNMVFQTYALFPHMSVAENVAFGLRVEGVAAMQRKRRVEEALALVKLEGLGGRRPDQLSGGQKQRVALARALVKRPRVLLLDEPLSALDAKLRAAMRAELAALQAQLGITFVFVTHDQDEALAMASRCAVMRLGHIEQIGAADELYESPTSRFVAEFIGETNLFPAAVERTPEGLVVRSPELAAAVVFPSGLVEPGRQAWLSVRPEQIRILADGEGAGRAPEPDQLDALATVRSVAYLGGALRVTLQTADDRELIVVQPNLSRDARLGLVSGAQVRLRWPRQALRLVAG
ncbi:MAG TPA: ABC transporter ATP-binding protein [Caulobacteraceae bacterium]|jgi:spermidine/putrescine transport system ATP-binding protein|nr:ABC transporter ATP-binding protein [Caulobacteraceae bacterium]